MTVDEAFKRIKNQRVELVFLNGKTSTGKSTFAKRLNSQLGFTIIDLDDLITASVMLPHGLTERSEVVPEIYKFRNRKDWLKSFVSATRQLIQSNLKFGKPVVVDGALANPTTIQETFDGFDGYEIFFFHPKDLERYNNYLTSRFKQSDIEDRANLPNNFWNFIAQADFRHYLNTGELNKGISQSINAYATRSKQNSDKRLAKLTKNFDNVIVIEI